MPSTKSSRFNGWILQPTANALLPTEAEMRPVLGAPPLLGRAGLSLGRGGQDPVLVGSSPGPWAGRALPAV